MNSGTYITYWDHLNILSYLILIAFREVITFCLYFFFEKKGLIDFTLLCFGMTPIDS